MRLLALLDDVAHDPSAVEGAYRTAFALEWEFWANPHLPEAAGRRGMAPQMRSEA
jgi:hypothetical protein